VSAVNANFTCSRLSDCDLSQAELRQAKFQNASLPGTRFVTSDLTGADFREASMGGSDLCGAVLRNVRFGGGKLLGADLRGTDLTGARELAQQQLQQARTDTSTTLPNGSRGPYLRFSITEKPRTANPSSPALLRSRVFGDQ
jgi:uncharacterized protein YjbI with pentapeptide repeats